LSGFAGSQGFFLMHHSENLLQWHSHDRLIVAGFAGARSAALFCYGRKTHAVYNLRSLRGCAAPLLELA
jgi:hypothetical protein